MNTMRRRRRHNTRYRIMHELNDFLLLSVTLGSFS
jgi:hypothetical protein